MHTQREKLGEGGESSGPLMSEVPMSLYVKSHGENFPTLIKDIFQMLSLNLEYWLQFPSF